MLSDADIIIRCRAGQIELFDLLVERYKGNLFGFCIKLTGKTHDAEELFQDTWVKVMKNIEKYQDKGKFLAWLLTICVNLYKDKRRKNSYIWNKVIGIFKNDEEEDFVEISKKTSLQDEVIVKSETERKLREQIISLDDIYKIPILLFYYREFGINEISDILEIPAGTVKSRLSKAKSILKEKMEN